MYNISFNPRWREELVATSNEGTLVFELTMGKYHVYFPDKSKWVASVPDWAKEKWEIYSEACNEWCTNNKIPITITDDAHVYEEK
jgi:hypothetical protein